MHRDETNSSHLRDAATNAKNCLNANAPNASEMSNPHLQREDET